MISWLKKQPISRLLLVSVVVALAGLTAVAWLANPANRETLLQVFIRQRGEAQAQNDAPPAPADKDNGNSDADRIARLHRYLEADEKQLEDAKKRLNDPKSEYRRAEADFTKVDAELAEKTRELQKFRKAGKTAEADAQEKSLEPLKTRRKDARERFDLALQERKTLQQRVAKLPEKIDREKKALEKLEGPGVHAPAQETPAQAKAPAASCEGHHKGNAQACDHARPPTVASVIPPGRKPATTPVGTEEKAEAARPSKKMQEASDRASKTEEAARTAQERVQNINGYLENLRGQIAEEQQLLATAHRRAEVARRKKAELEQTLQQRTAARAPADELARLRQEISEEAARLEQAEADAGVSTDRLADMQNTLNLVQTRRTEALKEADQRDREAEKARKKIAELENPFTPRNVLQWFLDHGPRLLVILLGMLLLHRLVNLSSRRIVRLMTRGTRSVERLDEEDRAETLVGVFRNTASLLILGGGILMLLDELGIPIVPLMGGAAVFGLAVAFGAQNLIKDYFSGFMVLMEDQYAVNDVIRIGTIEGKVERISLRITVLRDVMGVVHFIPHGTITTVSNMTHGFSRAFFEIGVAYKEDADQVMAVLMDLAHEVRTDPEFGPLILDDPEMLGVDSFGESSVMIKFYVNTKPLKAGLVKRELLRRIKRRFDQLGIEIPFPHRTIYHHHGDGQTPEQADEGNSRSPYAA